MSSQKPTIYRPPRLLRWLLAATSLALAGLIAALLAVLVFYLEVEPELPNTDTLREFKYQIPLSVYSRDGKFIAQFGDKKRIPVKFEEVPRRLVQAVLAAEDDRFFDHPGVDYQGLLRAALRFAQTGEKRQGGSTITMQVARNFFLSSEKTFIRKLKEIFLALRIERELNKREILELYLNKIYLGHHAYGVGAAAQAYFGKPLQELDLAQFALLAGLPKAPSQYNPFLDPDKALARRGFVLQRMRKLNQITDDELQAALIQPVPHEAPKTPIELDAPYVAEMVRNQMVERYGEDAYVNGYKVYTTVDSRLQTAAEWALRTALHDYDDKHGYRGPIAHLEKISESAANEKLTSLETIGDTIPALVVAVDSQSVKAKLKDGSTAEIGWDGLKWARRQLSVDNQGAIPRSARNVARVGDIIRVRQDDQHAWRLTQVPEVEGALVAVAPDSGAMVALEGGFDFFHSKYNRAIQAHRQPGSGFKPIVYATALEQGYTLASILSDTPFVYVDPWQDKEWRPHNYSNKYSGPIRLREALIHSSNLATVRLANDIGIHKVIATATRFGLPKEQLPSALSLALGSGSATPLQMARVYATFANGGFLVTPYFIERVETAEGALVFQATPPIACRTCPPGQSIGNSAPRILSPTVHYLMHSVLQDVVRRGTAQSAMQLKRNDLAGKTGTTNEQKDAWFNGYTPGLVAVTWVGYDASLPLGKNETGGHTALPMWTYFMGEALRDVPEQRIPPPDGIVSVRTNRETGVLAGPGDGDTMFEFFQENALPPPPAPEEPQETNFPEGEQVVEPTDTESLF